MGLFELFNRKDTPAPVVKPPAQATLHRSRVEGLNKWYSVNRAFLNSPNNSLRQNLDKTRDLSRLLCTIDPYASRYLELLSVYVVGDQGFQIDPQVIGRNGALDAQVNSMIKNAWEEWSEEASFDKRFSLKELEAIGIRTVGRDGESLFRLVVGKEVNKFGFALHSIDPQLLDIQYNAKLGENRYVWMGVEYDGINRVAYHIWNRYPDDAIATGTTGRIRERIPAAEIVHIFDDDFGGLVRGLPWLTPVMTTLARYHEWMDVHLQAMELGVKAPLVLSTNEADTQTFDDVSVSNTKNADGTTSANNNTVRPQLDITDQSILELPPNKTLTALDLQFPNSQLGAAAKVYLQSIAAGLQVSYMSLTTDASADSGRTIAHGSAIERDHWRQVQGWFAQQFHKKVYRAWLEAAILNGALKLPSPDPTKYYRVAWRARGFKGMDPLKDVRAITEAIAQGLLTRTQVVAEYGGNWEDNMKRLSEEQKVATALGVALPELADRLSLAQQVADLENTPSRPAAAPIEDSQ